MPLRLIEIGQDVLEENSFKFYQYILTFSSLSSLGKDVTLHQRKQISLTLESFVQSLVEIEREEKEEEEEKM